MYQSCIFLILLLHEVCHHIVLLECGIFYPAIGLAR